MKVKILGKEYPIKTSADEKYMNNVVSYVDGKMRDIKDALSLKSDEKVAILASLNIADEYFKQKQLYERMINELEEKIKTLTSSLDI